MLPRNLPTLIPGRPGLGVGGELVQLAERSEGEGVITTSAEHPVLSTLGVVLCREGEVSQ